MFSILSKAVLNYKTYTKLRVESLGASQISFKKYLETCQEPT